MNEQPRKVHEVVSRILRDTDFAAEIKEHALAAVKGGAASEAFYTYFDRFAATPGALESLGNPDAANCACESTTYFTISSLVTPIPMSCNTTTTTTTTGGYFGAQ
ncbi:MAG: hypothetical protein JO299_21230 [Gammaproteobacteria bacterium]|nr:hypothetical protein [Gammaproteobacteria bacterium]